MKKIEIKGGLDGLKEGMMWKLHYAYWSYLKYSGELDVGIIRSLYHLITGHDFNYNYYPCPQCKRQMVAIPEHIMDKIEELLEDYPHGISTLTIKRKDLR